MKNRYAILTLALASASLVAESASAQNFLLPSTPEKGIWVESTHTRFEELDVDLPSTVWFFSGRLPLTHGFSAVVDVPFSYARIEDAEAGNESSTTFGNPYVGLELAALQDVSFELGMRLPLNTADEESFADMVAFVADPLRPEAFLEDVVPVTAAATIERALPAGFGIRARGGVTGLFDTSEESEDAEAAVDYGLVGAYTTGPVQMALGAVGRWYASSDEGDFAENSLHHAALSADVDLGGVRPGVSLRVPLDSEYRDLVNSSLGIYLQVPIR
ncbi:MAG: hypothetical protein WD737_14685 [Gemmatimonadota bacterium]